MQDILLEYTPPPPLNTVKGWAGKHEVRYLAHSTPASVYFLKARPQNLPPSKEAPDMAAIAPSNQTWDFSCNLDVKFETEEDALIAYTALAVDKELQPDKVKRVMSVSNNKLSVHFEAIEARLLRASFSAFVDVLTLATETIQHFGQN